MRDAIRRIDREPAGALVAKSIVNGSFGRKDELRSFLDVLCRIEGNYSIFLDGEWGVGKTFFVNQAIAALRSFSSTAFLEEYGIDKAMAAQISEAVGPDSWSDSNVLVPAYFNAWKYDFADNPTVPLLDSLIESFPDQSDSLKAARGARDVIVSMLRGFSLNAGYGPVSVGYAPPDGQGKLTDSISLQKQVRERIGEILEKCLEGRGDRAVLFIDELDRCRPDYAAKVLEATKFLFDQRNLTIVFSVNARALSSALSSRFGEGFSGPRYLMRFYDRKICLHEFDNVGYLSSFSELDGPLSFELIDITCGLAKSRDLTMRDLNRCVTYLKGSFRSIEKHNAVNALHEFAAALPIDLALHFGSNGITPGEFFSSEEYVHAYAMLVPKLDFLNATLLAMESEYFALENSREQNQIASAIDICQSRMIEILGIIATKTADVSPKIPFPKRHDLVALRNIVTTSFELGGGTP